MRRNAISLCLLCSLFFLGADSLLAAVPLQIAAAADLQPLLPSILVSFRAKYGVEVTASYGSSSTLATQIVNGAPFALFLSADVGFAQRVIDAKLANADHPVPYARGTLALWERRDGPVQPLTIEALRSSSVQAISIANPEHAPYGRAAVASLTSLHLMDAVRPRLKTAENIAQAAQFVESGNAQVGLISLTSALTDKLRSEGTYLTMPADTYPPIVQAAVILRRDPLVEKEAQSFLDYLLSPTIQKELAMHGLKPARQEWPSTSAR